jgi:hypothetical protein
MKTTYSYSRPEGGLESYCSALARKKQDRLRQQLAVIEDMISWAEK